MKNVSRFGIAAGAVLLVAAGFWAGTWRAERLAPAQEDRALYHCPMHPQVVSDKPGVCPICSMKLVKREAAGPDGRRILYYRNPMDPSIRSETPAKDSMGMDFIPVYEEDMSTAKAVDGRVAVALSPERRSLLGIRSESVLRAPFSRDIRTVGRVAVDERLLHHV